MEREQEIRCVAYELWRVEGQPEGRALDHWLKAMQILEQREKESQHLAEVAVTLSAAPLTHVQQKPAKGTRTRGRHV